MPQIKQPTSPKVQLLQEVELLNWVKIGAQELAGVGGGNGRYHQPPHLQLISPRITTTHLWPRHAALVGGFASSIVPRVYRIGANKQGDGMGITTVVRWAGSAWMARL